MNIILSIVVFIIILSVTILVHEFGHFATAKKFGVYCREFALGMGKKIFSRQVGETEYSIRLIPMGGFVMMVGEDGEISGELHEGDTVWLELSKDNKVTKIYATNPLNDVTKEVDVLAFSQETEPMKLTTQTDDGVVQYLCENLVEYIDASNYEQPVVAKTRQFSNIKPWKKVVVLVAGVCMNFISSFIFILLATFISGVNVSPVIATDVYPNESGNQVLLADDEITQIDGKAYAYKDLLAFVKANPGKDIVLNVSRAGQDVQIKRKIMTINTEEMGKDGVVKTKYGVLGVQYKKSHSNVIAIIGTAFTTFIGFFQQVFLTLANLFTGKVSPKNLAGFIGIAQMTGSIIAAETATTGALMHVLEVVGRLLLFAGLLGVNIGALNLLPIPALDGGRIVFALYEMIFRKKASAKVEMVVNAAGFILLIGLFVMVTFFDISRLFSR